MTAINIAKVPPLILGDGVLSQLPTQIARWAVKSVLIVSDEGLALTGLVEKIRILVEQSIPVKVFLAPAGEPHVETVDEGARQIRLMDSPLVIGIGGGTALDIAKLIAGLAVSDRPMKHYLLCANPWQGSVPKIMIPTTSGTGAEVTRTCVLSDENNNKSWAWGDELSPELVMLDPQASKSLPAMITAATGLDALVHAVEAATSQSNNVISSANALQAIKLVNRNLKVCVDNPINLTARLNMQQAAYLAGIAIDNCGTGIAHNIGHSLGSLYNIPHGIAVTVGLMASLPWSLSTQMSAYQDVAVALNCKPDELPKVLNKLLIEVNFSQCLKRYQSIIIDVVQLSICMQSTENIPMANNNSRLPQSNDWSVLAQETKNTFKALSS
jgi:alcohol dehydrogenase class IV